MEPIYIPIIFCAGLFAGVINTLAGGGSLLTLPLLILLGLPSSVANGTNRVAIWIQCIIAATSFHNKGVSRIKFGFVLSVTAVLGAVIGSQIAISIPDEAFNQLLAIVMLVMVGIIVWNPKTKPNPKIQLQGWRLFVVPLVFFLIGIYGGLIQAGVGFFITAALTLICGYDLVYTASIKVLVVSIYMTFSLFVFIYYGQIDWAVALVLASGNGLGGWIGSKIAIAKGDKWIRVVLVVAVVAMTLKLLGLSPI